MVFYGNQRQLLHRFNDILLIETYYQNLSEYKIGSKHSFSAIVRKTLYSETSRY
jgi:hypothetical protein